jgi:RNA polymerase sigma-70 factor (ECF subfamily)
MELQTSTCDLVERFQRGEQGAFSLLFGKYRRRLAVLVHYKMSDDLRSRLEVDDILQEVFLAAAQGLERFNYQSPGSFMAWLSCIADHAVVDAARYENRQKRRAEEMLSFKTESNPNGAEPMDLMTPSRVFAQRESVQALLRKMDVLSPEYREVILLAKFEGLTTFEISKRLGKSRESVALLLHRALKRFREIELGPENQ